MNKIERLPEKIIQIQDISQKINKRISSDLNFFLKGEITADQFFLLRKIKQQGRCTPSELAHSMSVERSAITIMLNKLENKGYINRTRSNQNRRTVRVEITDDAQIILEKGLLVIKESNKMYAKKLTEQEWDNLLSLALKLNFLI